MFLSNGIGQSKNCAQSAVGSVGVKGAHFLMAKIFHPQKLKALAVASTLCLTLAACSSSARVTTQADYSSLSPEASRKIMGRLSRSYQARPNNKAIALKYSSILRANGQSDQAVAVMERTVLTHEDDAAVHAEYARALGSAGRFEQALQIVDRAIDPANPTWDLLSLKGVMLDQLGQHESARKLYRQGLAIAPNQATLHANYGLSYAMTGDLRTAETYLSQAVQLPTVTTKVWKNLALVIGLQGRFDRARAIYERLLVPEQVEANMNYIRALLTQQNRWDLISKQDKNKKS